MIENNGSRLFGIYFKFLFLIKDLFFFNIQKVFIFDGRREYLLKGIEIFQKKMYYKEKGSEADWFGLVKDKCVG